MEHYGSTSVPGLCAKPTVDILIGLNKFVLTPKEKHNLEMLGYEYIGRALSYERIFLKKDEKHSFHLAVVRFAGSVWNDGIAVRDYLRTNHNKAMKYAAVKSRAIEEGFSTVLMYSEYKRNFVEQMVLEAKGEVGRKKDNRIKK